MSSPPRVAIVGGGIAGSLCALVLRSRGLAPTIYDMGNHSVGGRMGQSKRKGASSDNGAQFFCVRENGSSFSQAVRILSENGLVAPWEGRFGLLGSKGGFLPREIIGSTAVTKLAKDHQGPQLATDSDDFCGFINAPSSSTLFVGVPSMHGVCEGLCSMADVSVHGRECVTDAVLDEATRTWKITSNLVGKAESEEPVTRSGFQALVVATHASSFPEQIVRQIRASNNDVDHGKVADRLTQLLAALEESRLKRTEPAITLAATFPAGSLSEHVPFDAAGCPSSKHIQFVVREASKPGRSTDAEEVWTAISTASFARNALKQGSPLPEIADDLAQEVRILLTPFFNGDLRKVPSPVKVTAKGWTSAFTNSFESPEECISLEPWKLTICGDYIRSHPSPLEAAALSGMDAGERIASWFAASVDE